MPRRSRSERGAIRSAKGVSEVDAVGSSSDSLSRSGVRVDGIVNGRTIAGVVDCGSGIEMT